MQIGLVLVIAASALQRLRLYYAIYGLTESRLHAMALPIWMELVLWWLGPTVLRGGRHAFAFGSLASGLTTVALLFAINADTLVARVNVARVASLSADAVPVLIDALRDLPPDVQCPLARHMLRSWPPERERSVRAWNWSAARASAAVREHEVQCYRWSGRRRSARRHSQDYDESSDLQKIPADDDGALKVSGRRLPPHRVGDRGIVRRHEVRQHQCLHTRPLGDAPAASADV